MKRPRNRQAPAASADERAVATGMKLVGIGVAIMIFAGLFGAHS